MSKSKAVSPVHRYLPAAGALFIVLAVYLYSLCPEVYLIDSGELAVVSYTLGIAHPTGYPLYTLISYFFAHLPGEPIWNLNMLSALFSITAAAFLYALAYRINENKVTPLITVSLFAFSPIIWRTSVTNEVHSLTALFAMLLFFLAYRCDNDRIFYLTMYLIGLSLTNHMMIFSLSFPLLIYVLVVYRPSLNKIAIGILFLLIGLTLYYYLVARTNGGAKFAWGNTAGLQRLLWHMSGKQYRVWMFSGSLSDIMQNLINGAQLLARNFLYVLVLPCLFGFYVVYKRNRRIFWLLLVILIANVLYTINYSIPDIESYYVPTLVVLVITFTYGIKQLHKYLKSPIIMIIALALPIINYRSCTLRRNTFGMDFGRANTLMLPGSSLLIANYWDTYAPLMYSREIKKIRKDLVVIDKELLRRTWYLKFIEREYPDFYEKVRPLVDSYLVELYKFEYDRPYQPQVIQSRFVKMLEGFVDAKIEEGVFFASPWPDRDLESVRPEYPRIPFGLVHRVVRDMKILPFDFGRFDLTPPPIINDDRLKNNILIVRNMLRQNIIYLEATGNQEQAAKVRAILQKF